MCIAGKRVRIARRVGEVRTRWPRHRKTRRAAPFTAVRVGEASDAGPLSTKHLPFPHCPTWLSHCGTLRKNPALPLHDWLHPLICKNGTSPMRTQWRRADEDDDVARSQEARQWRLDHGEPCIIGHEQFTLLHSNFRGFISRVAELSARLRLMKSKPSVLCLTETWAD